MNYSDTESGMDEIEVRRRSGSQSQKQQRFSEACLLSYFTEYCNFRYDKLIKKDKYNKIWEETVMGCVNPMKPEFRLNNI
jgi:hypothetical protein